MVLVRTLPSDEEGPTGDDWVLVEKRGGLYFITARQSGKAVDASVETAGFDSPEAAIRAATTWADLLTAPVIYVREFVNAPRP
jgi:hypothetical protein